MEINCQNPTIIRNPEFNKFITQGFIYIYNKTKLLTILTKQDIEAALEDNYVKVEQLKINLGYILINPEININNLPEKITDVYKYTSETGIIKKQYSEQFLKYVKPYRDQYKRLYSITYDQVKDFQMVNQETGEAQPVFVLVDCCHCVLCQKKKRNRLSSRVVLESLNHQYSPLFITLTYATENYPVNCSDIKEHTTEIQKFNKRLRKALEPYGVRYKYFFVSEYGSLRGRLHYHGILFGLNTPELTQLVPCDFMKYDNKFLDEVFLITKLIYNSWKKGIIDVQIAEDVSGKYVSKYVGKTSSGRLTKSLKSQKLGNHVFTAKKIEEIRQNTSKNSFYCLIDNKLEEIPLYSWIQTQVYPSLARQMSREFRTLLLSTYNNMCYYGLKDTEIYKRFADKYYKFIQLLGYTDYPLNSTKSKISVEMYNTIANNINKLNTYDYDVDKVTRINDLRNEHIMLSNVLEYDVDYNCYIENIRLSNQKNNERDFQ